jgi:hypothetical protein
MNDLLAPAKATIFLDKAQQPPLGFQLNPSAENKIESSEPGY